MADWKFGYACNNCDHVFTSNSRLVMCRSICPSCGTQVTTYDARENRCLKDARQIAFKERFFKKPLIKELDQQIPKP